RSNPGPRSAPGDRGPGWRLTARGDIQAPERVIHPPRVELRRPQGSLPKRCHHLTGLDRRGPQLPDDVRNAALEPTGLVDHADGDRRIRGAIGDYEAEASDSVTEETASPGEAPCPGLRQV